MVVAGDGGSGKSTLIDELVRRFLDTFPDKKIAVLANDPTTASGGTTAAFLADRVRMNNIYDERVWLRSVATGSVYAPLSPALPAMAGVSARPVTTASWWRRRGPARPVSTCRRCGPTCWSM